MKTDTDRHCIDLTQLSSREQLSALMDGALPEDQTRFLLRRLQHDTELADCWGRWRIAGEAMRGLAPARHLSADFALCVSVALHGKTTAPVVQKAARSTGWLRWGGGISMAAALAVVALIARPTLQGGQPSVAAPAAQRVASQPVSSLAPKPRPQAPVPAALVDAPVVFAATAAVATAKPARRAGSRPQPVANRLAMPAAEVAPLVDSVAVELPAIAPPVSGIATRPWPHSILPQYSGNSDLTVGFAARLPRAMASNPFASPVFSASPKLLVNEVSRTQVAKPDQQVSAESQPQH